MDDGPFKPVRHLGRTPSEGAQDAQSHAKSQPHSKVRDACGELKCGTIDLYLSHCRLRSRRFGMGSFQKRRIAPYFLGADFEVDLRPGRAMTGWSSVKMGNSSIPQCFRRARAHLTLIQLLCLL